MTVLRLARALRSARDDERGAALATVIAFMFAGVLLSLVVAGTVLNAFTFSSTTRAGVQAQAAAEAGIAVARAGLLSGTCGTQPTPGRYESLDPGLRYSVQVAYRSAGGDWVDGCPTPSQEARLRSTGTASTPGANGDSSNDIARVEAVLSGAASDNAPTTDGPAIFAYDAAGFGGSGTLIAAGGADVMLRTGDVNCDGASQGAANLVIKSGNLIAGGSCRIEGSVWVNGDANLTGNPQIGGSLTARNVDAMATIGGNIWADQEVKLNQATVKNGSWVSGGSINITGGNLSGPVWARTGNAIVAGNITGRVTAQVGDVTVGNAGQTMTGGVTAAGVLTVTGGSTSGGSYASSLRHQNGTLNTAVIGGPACITGGTRSNITARSKDPGTGCQTWNTGWGTLTPTAAAPVPAVSPGKPAAVEVPEWIDFGNDPVELTSAYWGDDYDFYVVPANTNCQGAAAKALFERFGNRPGVIDARGCKDQGAGDWAPADFLLDGGHAVTLYEDVVVIANDINIGGGATITGVPKIENGKTVNPKLWLITPDKGATPNARPDCATGDRLRINGGPTFTTIDFMIYTPCKVVLDNGIKLSGQVFAGGATIAGSTQLTFVAVGLPGYDLSTGLPTSTPGDEWDRSVVVQRNRTAWD